MWNIQCNVSETIQTCPECEGKHISEGIKFPLDSFVQTDRRVLLCNVCPFLGHIHPHVDESGISF